ncbi:MAG: LysE family translocator [Alphaproteobacteria bacterium]|nr:LysE family translocator [Alphaproteobacteria bacterium]
MTVETIFIFAMSIALIWVKLGPGQALKITSGFDNGFWAGMSVALGIVLSCNIYFLVAALGSVFVTNFFNDIGFFFKIIGALYLFYLGYQGLENAEKGLLKVSAGSVPKPQYIQKFMAGLILGLGNPIAIVYFISILPTLVPVDMLSVQDILAAMTIMTVIGLIIDSLILLLVSQTKQALSDTKIVRSINTATSIGFVCIGLFLLYSAFFLENYSFDIL